MAIVTSRTPTGALQFDIITPLPLERFKAEAVTVSCPIVEETADRVEYWAVVVFIYKWLG